MPPARIKAALAALAALSSFTPREAAADDYLARIQPILDRRCLACHSCYNAPCQLQLGS